MEVNITINGSDHASDVEPRTLLVDHIRRTVGLTGTHVGCDTTSCGACTVLMDGKPVKACTVLAAQADGSEVTTVEGLKGADGLHPIQSAFTDDHGLQCGFCTPGMMLVGASLIAENPDPSDDDVRWAISGNLCRCTGYINIVKAIQTAAARVAAASESNGS
ncbi:(2Fe-2S)-binding protein [Candidatus Poriferisocius sp.]|uniref:(2Fe-2S)-binding protein n=1 Tax=Candidatus Poriferisocius sp. TaxID=3101276 RepID=UPI003B019A36